ncbi:uncharacterized protein V1518DRAFT_408061 [Limtongia smithiae]|uniref:uncharacterized protein n=1 Tax=Limtongia smithiae TaxID=1125753 RepID=UPI0034CF8043
MYGQETKGRDAMVGHKQHTHHHHHGFCACGHAHHDHTAAGAGAGDNTPAVPTGEKRGSKPDLISRSSESFLGLLSGHRESASPSNAKSSISSMPSRAAASTHTTLTSRSPSPSPVPFEEPKLPVYIAPPPSLPLDPPAGLVQEDEAAGQSDTARLEALQREIMREHEGVTAGDNELDMASLDRALDSEAAPGHGISDTTPRWRATGDIPATADSYFIPNMLLPEALADSLFRELLINDTEWHTRYHRGGAVPRLMAMQADIPEEHGWYPIYRHPLDPPTLPTLPFSRIVKNIKYAIEAAVGHPFNHVLLHQYRSGEDYISEHADKTLDIAPGSKIVNLSLGAERSMTFRKKREETAHERHAIEKALAAGDLVVRDFNERESETEEGEEEEMSGMLNTPAARVARVRTTAQRERTRNYDIHPANEITHTPRRNQRIRLSHNSIVVLGSRTNREWTHSIRPDRRDVVEKSPDQTAFDGVRISLTFRLINTFAYPAGAPRPSLIYGQGATSKTRENAAPVLYYDNPDPMVHEKAKEQARDMLNAFALDNKLGEEFEWEKAYGSGFDVAELPIVETIEAGQAK